MKERSLNLLPTHETTGSSPWVVFSGGHSCFIRTVLSGKDMGNYATSRGVKTWHILAQIINAIIAASPSVLDIQRVSLLAQR